MSFASTSAENAATTAVIALIGYLSLHTGSTGTTGANEVPSETRVAETFGTVTGGSVSNNTSVSIGLAANTTVTFVGHFGSLSGSDFVIGGSLTSSISTSTTAGTVTFAIGADTISSS